MKMNEQQEFYFITTPSKDINLRDWAILGDSVDAHAIYSLWTAKVLSILHDSEIQADKNAYMRLSKQSKVDRMSVIDDIVANRTHQRGLLPIVNRKEIVAAEEQATKMEHASAHRSRINELLPIPNQSKRNSTTFGVLPTTAAPTTLRPTQSSSRKNISISSSGPSTKAKDAGYLVPDDLSTTSSSSRKRKPTDAVEVGKKMKKGSAKFGEEGRKSLQGRYSALGPKWTLASGTVVEDILYEAGKNLACYHPIHSFMVNLQDPYTQSLFSDRDWSEVSKDVPQPPKCQDSTKIYIEKFSKVKSKQELSTLLRIVPEETEQELVHRCLRDWSDIFEIEDPSPFAIQGSLSESWWTTHVWGVCDYLTKGIPGHYIINGEKAG
ncbi:hypothetical protein BGZ65_004959, partial [Modicella reniformis]